MDPAGLAPAVVDSDSDEQDSCPDLTDCPAPSMLLAATEMRVNKHSLEPEMAIWKTATAAWAKHAEYVIFRRLKRQKIDGAAAAKVTAGLLKPLEGDDRCH